MIMNTPETLIDKWLPMLDEDSNKEEPPCSDKAGIEPYVVPRYVLVVITVMHFSSSLVFAPFNLKALIGFLKISTKKQPMFLFFAVVHIVCIMDLMVG